MTGSPNSATSNTPRASSPGIPSASDVARRALMVIGFPLLAWFLPRDTAQGAVGGAVPWELLVFLVLAGLSLLVHYSVRAPRPRFDRTVDKAEWKPLLRFPAISRVNTSRPGARANAGAVGCAVIEGFMLMVAIVLGVLLAWILRPDMYWPVIAASPLVLAIAYGIRLSRSRRYLRALQSEGHPG